MNKPIIIGTRGSKLALAQAEFVASGFHAAQGICKIQIIKTSGDLTHHPLYDLGGKGLFVKEVQEALLKGEIDVAVHSMKDIPAEIPKGLCIAAIPKREDPRDVFISKKCSILNDLPPNSLVGTASPRRQSLIKDLRNDLKIIPIRGNVDTRIMKLNKGEVDAIILAAAGLVRLKRSAEICEYFPVDRIIPAVGQGALAIETREEDYILTNKLRELFHDEKCAIEVCAERAFLREIKGDCHTPLGAFAKVVGSYVEMIAYLSPSVEQKGCVEKNIASIIAAEALGRGLASKLISRF